MSTLKTNNVQVGQSLTATNNFTLYQPSTPDGTVRLGVGNTGATTADVITATSAGNVGVGTSSPAYKLDVNGQIRGDFVIRATQGSVTSYLVGNSGGFGAVGTASNHPILFNTNDTERWRIDSGGSLWSALTGLVNPAINAGVYGVRVEPDGSVLCAKNGNIAGYWGRSNDGQLHAFYRNAVGVGNISVTASSTAYVTSSDYRLKENVQPMTGALAKVAALNPVTYTWKATGEDSQGFIAHELQAVVPDAVTGEKDEVDADGNPVYQGIDTSFLVATLTAAIQEQQALITSLTARIAALEGAQ
jgi:hypothetical protein